MLDLIRQLRAIHPLTAEFESHLLTIIKEIKLSKRSMLLREGQICRNIYFVSKGLLRSFYRSEDGEITNWLLKEKDVIISVKSFYLQNPSLEFIEALEDCHLFYISFQELQKIYVDYPTFNFIGRVLTEQYNLLLAEYNYFTKLKPTTQRYKYLVDHFPELASRVANKDIASFLGISETHLSTVKSKKD